MKTAPIFLGLLTGVLLAGCGITLKRDMRSTPPQQVVYDDLCNLQPYHDTILTRQATPPSVAQTQEMKNTDNTRVEGGRTRFLFDTPFQLETVRRVLHDNWSDLPGDVDKADKIELEVRWSQKAGVRRVVTEENAELSVGRSRGHALPYHVCLSELLFGEPLYRTRRELLGLTPLPPAQPTALEQSTDQ